MLGALKTAGGYLRYAQNGLALGAAFQRSTLPAGTDVDGWTLGGSWSGGPWYVNAGLSQNKRKDPFPAAGGNVDQSLLGLYWQGAANGGFLMGDADQRRMVTLGLGYQITPALNLGAHYYHTKQSGSAGGNSNGKADFIVAVANYVLSKRTSVYTGLDYTKTGGGQDVLIEGNGTRKRSGLTLGLRHTF